MPNLQRVRVLWSGSPVVGGGVSTFYLDEAATGHVAAIRQFFQSINAFIASGVLIDVQPSGDLIDIATGALTGAWNESGVGQVVATGSGLHVGGTGARVVWATSGIRNGRRVKGSTFIAPLSANLFEADGTPVAAAITAIEGAASALRAALPTQLIIYSRPGGGLPGLGSPVISSSVPNRASWLRSRRT